MKRTSAALDQITQYTFHDGDPAAAGTNPAPEAEASTNEAAHAAATQAQRAIDIVRSRIERIRLSKDGPGIEAELSAFKREMRAAENQIDACTDAGAPPETVERLQEELHCLHAERILVMIEELEAQPPGEDKAENQQRAMNVLSLRIDWHCLHRDFDAARAALRDLAALPGCTPEIFARTAEKLCDSYLVIHGTSSPLGHRPAVALKYVEILVEYGGSKALAEAGNTLTNLRAGAGAQMDLSAQLQGGFQQVALRWLQLGEVAPVLALARDLGITPDMRALFDAVPIGSAPEWAALSVAVLRAREPDEAHGWPGLPDLPLPDRARAGGTFPPFLARHLQPLLPQMGCFLLQQNMDLGQEAVRRAWDDALSPILRGLQSLPQAALRLPDLQGQPVPQEWQTEWLSVTAKLNPCARRMSEMMEAIREGRWDTALMAFRLLLLEPDCSRDMADAAASQLCSAHESNEEQFHDDPATRARAEAAYVAALLAAGGERLDTAIVRVRAMCADETMAEEGDALARTLAEQLLRAGRTEAASEFARNLQPAAVAPAGFELANAGLVCSAISEHFARPPVNVVFDGVPLHLRQRAAQQLPKLAAELCDTMQRRLDTHPLLVFLPALIELDPASALRIREAQIAGPTPEAASERTRCWQRLVDIACLARASQRAAAGHADEDASRVKDAAQRLLDDPEMPGFLPQLHPMVQRELFGAVAAWHGTAALCEFAKKLAGGDCGNSEREAFWKSLFKGWPGGTQAPADFQTWVAETIPASAIKHVPPEFWRPPFMDALRIRIDGLSAVARDARQATLNAEIQLASLQEALASNPNDPGAQLFVDHYEIVCRTAAVNDRNLGQDFLVFLSAARAGAEAHLSSVADDLFNNPFQAAEIAAAIPAVMDFGVALAAGDQDAQASIRTAIGDVTAEVPL